MTSVLGKNLTTGAAQLISTLTESHHALHLFSLFDLFQRDMVLYIY